jgi:hypothetical protein
MSLYWLMVTQTRFIKVIVKQMSLKPFDIYGTIEFMVAQVMGKTVLDSWSVNY